MLESKKALANEQHGNDTALLLWIVILSYISYDILQPGFVGTFLSASGTAGYAEATNEACFALFSGSQVTKAIVG